MSILKPTRDAALFDASAIAGAVALLTDAARKDFASVEAQLKAAGFGITGYAPIQAMPDIDASVASDIGEVIEGRGIYHGAWHPRANGGIVVHAYSDADLLEDSSGKQLLLTWYQTRDELARRNDGRKYGNGTEVALNAALAKPSGAKGAYKDGDLIMGPQVLLNGVNSDGDKVRAENTCDLLRGSKGEAFKAISKTLRDAGSTDARRSWSCTEVRGYPYFVRAVSLSDGLDGWVYRVYGHLGVLPFRLFREPHVVKAINHLTLQSL